VSFVGGGQGVFLSIDTWSVSVTMIHSKVLEKAGIKKEDVDLYEVGLGPSTFQISEFFVLNHRGDRSTKRLARCSHTASRTSVWTLKRST
jgi:hypothetical protein